MNSSFRARESGTFPTSAPFSAASSARLRSSAMSHSRRIAVSVAALPSPRGGALATPDPRLLRAERGSWQMQDGFSARRSRCDFAIWTSPLGEENRALGKSPSPRGENLDTVVQSLSPRGEGAWTKNSRVLRTEKPLETYPGPFSARRSRAVAASLDPLAGKPFETVFRFNFCGQKTLQRANSAPSHPAVRRISGAPGRPCYCSRRRHRRFPILPLRRSTTSPSSTESGEPSSCPNPHVSP